MIKTIYLRQIILVMLSLCLYGIAAGNTSLEITHGEKKSLFSTNNPVFKDIFYLSAKNDRGLGLGINFSQSLIAAITASETSICKGSSATLTAAPTGGSQPFNYLWSNGETTPSVSVSPNANTTYSLTVTDADGNSNSVSQLIEVKEAPFAPFSVHFKDCGSTLPKAHSIPYGFNQTFEWYSNPNRTGDIIPSRLVREVQDGETSIVSDFVFNRGTTTLNTSYYVFEKGSNGCYSPATEVPITVYPVPQTTPNVVTNFACGTSFKFEALPSGNNTIEWRTDFRAIFFGQTLGTENSYTLLNPENKRDSLWVFEVSPNKCYGAPALVRIFPTPPPPPVTDISLCVGDASKPIFTNPDYRWYTAATGDFPRFPAAEIVATAPSSSTFYISQIVDGCVSATRSELKAVVSPIPSSPTVIDVEYCQNETASALTAGGDNLKWYDANGVLLNGAPIPSTSTEGQASYSVSQTLNNCESPKAVINIKIKASPSTPSVSSVSQPTCSISTGTIVLNTQTGVEYSFDNGLTYQISNEKSGLITGDYLIKVKNAAGCESGVLTVKINAAPTAPSTPSVSSVLQPTCSISTGTIVLTAQSGVEYSFDNGLTYQMSNEKTGLNAGDYLIKVKNADGCESGILGANINAVPNAPSTPTELSVTQPTCSISTGTIVLNTQIGVEYSFDNGATYGILNEKSGLITGDYLIKVKNAAGCESGVLTVKINAAPTAPSPPSVSSVLQPTCSISTGTIVLNTQIGVEYSFDNGVTYQISNEKTGLNAGDYSIKVKNEAGCESGILLVKIDIAPTAPSTPSVSSVLQPTCSISTGTIVLNTQIGVEYSFDNGLTYGILNEKSGLNAGDYLIKVKNAAGCESGVLTVKINAAPIAPSPPSVSSVLQPTCSISTGTIVLNTQIGVEYSFDNGATYGILNEKSGLITGDYFIKVKNAAGCVSDVLKVTINPTPVAPSTPSVLSVVHATCSVPTGTVSINVQTGVQYSFDNGASYQTSNIKSGLASGTYKIMVKNTAGCESAAIEVVINAATTSLPAWNIHVTQPTCALPKGTIMITYPPSGYLYSFDNGASFLPSNTKSGLAIGTYSVVIKNYSGCVSAPKIVNIVAPVNTATNSIVASKTSVCSGETVKLNVAPYSPVCIYKWSNGGTTDPIYVNPITTTTYTVTVTNGGCTSVASKTIIVYPKLAKPKVNIIQPTCGTMGTITITNLPVGASSKINGTNWTLGKTVYSNLNGGNYTIKFKLGECESEEEKVVLNDAGFNFDPTKCYKIVNKNSGKVLDVFQNKTSNNIPIIQYAFNGGGNQKWQFSYTTGGYLKMKVQSSGKYLACHDNYNGADVYQYEYYSGGQKDWAIECVGNGDYRIVHRYSGKYLSVENNSKLDAAKVEIRYWANLDAQKWQIVEVPCAISTNLRQAGYMTAKAEAEVKQINITWYSNMGYKTDYYTVEKFNEQKAEFEEISTLNNTQYDDELHYFTYSDMSPMEGDNLYRIKAVFNDGTTQLSASLKVAFGNIKDVRLFPNPAADFIEILLNEVPKNAVTLTLNNMLGLPVIQKSYENEQRMYFEIKDIPNGIYQLHISQKGKRSMVKQVVIQK